MKKNKNKYSFNGGIKNVVLGALFVLGMFTLLYQLTDYSRHIKTISHTTFWDKVEEGKVRAVRVTGQEIQGTLKDNTRFEVIVGNDPHMWEKLREKGVEVIVNSSSSQFNLWFILPIMFLLATLLLIWYVTRQSRSTNGSGSGGNIFNMSKSRARLFMPSTIKETFESVAGAHEAKEDLKDIIDFLKTPEKYERLGAKITRGVLLIGAPGNGKTLLAKAVAGEANCPFFSVSGSDFIEVFVGVGAARVRDLFAQARKYAPCIIFIDEIDAVGRNRAGAGIGGGNDERDQTLNQLLTEMDGFQTSGHKVIVIAATNRADILDPALVRPGRFDRRVHVPFPDLVSRQHILEVHVKDVKLAADVDLRKIARGTPGFSGADLANLVNESAIIAAKLGLSEIGTDAFEQARDKIILGKENKTLIRTQEDLRVTAYHEAGHALVRVFKTNLDPLHKVTIVSRGSALGVTHSLPERDRHTLDREEYLGNIASALGGRIAEEIIFGKISTGAHSDFKAATDMARAMVCSYGMSKSLGVAIYSQEYGAYQYSQATAEKIDEEVQGILQNCYDDAKQVLTENRQMLEKLAEALLEKETLFAAEVYELLGIPPRADLRF